LLLVVACLLWLYCHHDAARELQCFLDNVPVGIAYEAGAVAVARVTVPVLSIANPVAVGNSLVLAVGYAVGHIAAIIFVVAVNLAAVEAGKAVVPV